MKVSGEFLQIPGNIRLGQMPDFNRKNHNPGTDRKPIKKPTMMRMKKIKRGILTCLCIIAMTGGIIRAGEEKRTRPSIFDHIELSIRGGEYFHYANANKYKEVKYPAYIYYLYSLDPFDDLEYFGSPIDHGALYLNFELKAKLKGFTLKTVLNTERRSMSSGVYEKRDLVAYPKIYFAYDTKIKIDKQVIQLGASVGNIDQFKLFEGLTIYNIDVAATNFFLKWKRLKFEFNKIGDLCRGIGLNINDENDYILSIDNIKLFKRWTLDLKTGITFYIKSDYHSYSMTAAIHNDNHFRLYSQLSFMYGKKPGISYSGRSAFLAGVQYKKDFPRFKIDITGEYRFYSGYFNLDFKGTHVIYLNGYLYPLYNYERYFSQWAVFTEYQDHEGNSLAVSGLTFQFFGQYYFYRHLYLFAMLDYNYIMARSETPFLYNFYEIGAGLEPFSNILLYIGYTNKGMNLTRHYQTFYLFKKPVLNLSIRFKFDIKL